MKKLVAFFVKRSLLVNMITIGLILAGIVYAYKINMEAIPVVDYGYVAVHTIYPGASPRDVEKHISIPIENQVREVDGIEEVKSTSAESSSFVLLKLDPDIENQDKIVSDIKSAIDRITDLPEDAEDPRITEFSTSIFSVLRISIIDKKFKYKDRFIKIKNMQGM